MHPNHPSSTRRRRETRLAPEALESRELLTGGAGDTFAIIPGTVAKAGDTAVVKFTIDPAHFTLPKGGFTLGLDIAAAPNTSLKPVVTSIIDSSGHPVRQTHGIYAPNLPNTAVKAGAPTSALLAPVHLNPAHPNDPVTYTVNVKGLQGSTGQFLLGFYLPGDTNGDGKVDQVDINAIKAALGSKAGSTRYNFDADATRDGRINKIDLTTARNNLGVATTITPVVAANLDPTGETLANSRTFNVNTTHFTGTASPGAAVKYAEVAQKSQPVATTADANGKYSLTVPLGDGNNTFRVTTLDAFGQSISGTIAPVTYVAAAPPISSLIALTSQPSTVKS